MRERKPGTPSSPFGIGLVQLGDEVRVETRLTENDPEKLRLGMEVELAFVPLYTDDYGEDILTWAFQPLFPDLERARSPTMNDVAIIGVGLHPFGRFGTNPP